MMVLGDSQLAKELIPSGQSLGKTKVEMMAEYAWSAVGRKCRKRGWRAPISCYQLCRVERDWVKALCRVGQSIL
jgi:hypothetical protein